jgi:hypothetical protein
MNVILYTSIPTAAAEDAVVGNQPNPAEDKIGFVDYNDVDRVDNRRSYLLEISQL